MQALGTQMWDVALAIQAILACNLSKEYGPTLMRAHDFVKASQVIICYLSLIMPYRSNNYWCKRFNVILKVRENPSGDFNAMYRHISKGAWTFSIQDQGLQVSDCTAEGLKVQPNSTK